MLRSISKIAASCAGFSNKTVCLLQKPEILRQSVAVARRCFSVEKPKEASHIHRSTAAQQRFESGNTTLEVELPEPHRGERFNNKDLYGIYFLFLASGLTAYLCFWQIRRYFWKRDLIAYRPLQDALSRVMVAFADRMGKTTAAFNKKFIKDFKETTEYMPVKLRGRYRYDQETLVGYASAPIDVLNTRRRETQRGYYVLTPFELETPVVVRTPSQDHGHDVEIVIKRVYVNRGWVISTVSKSYLAHPVYERSLHVNANGKRGPDIGEITEVNGVLWYGNRSPDDHSKAITSVARDGKSRTFQHMHLDVMAGELEDEFSIFRAGDNEYEAPTMVVDAHTPPPTRRVTALDVEIAQNVDTIAVSPVRKTMDDYLEFYTTPYNHIVYALTWGTFCLFSSYMLGAKYLFRETNIRKWFAKKNNKPITYRRTFGNPPTNPPK